MPKVAVSTFHLLTITLLALPTLAQPGAGVDTSQTSVVARQATAEEVGYQTIASPMLLEVSLGAHGKHQSLLDMDEQHTWTNT